MADLIEVKIGGTSVITSGKVVQNCTLSAALLTSGSLDGDRLPAMSTTKKGGVPATGTPTGLFLKDDGTWAAGGGGPHALDSTNNTVSGRTAGQVVRMTGATTFEIAALQLTDLPTVDATKGGTGQTTCAKGDLFIGSGSNTVAKLTVGANNKILTAASGEATGIKWVDDVATITFIIDGGGSAITTGVKGYIEVPFNCTVAGWTLLADQSGSIVVDVWKDTYANFPPLVADTIAGTGKPTISSSTKGQAIPTSNWGSTTITAGDILAFNVDSATTVTRVTLSIRVTKGW